MKDISLILLGALLAYMFDLIKRYSEKKGEKRNELIKQCNELILFCNKLHYYTEKWHQNFLYYHYYKEVHYLSKDPTISSVMLMYQKDYYEINEKISDLIANAEYCFDEIHRLTKVDFELDEGFIKEYKLELDNKTFNDIPKEKLSDLLDSEITKVDSILKNKYKPVFDRVKQKVQTLKIKN